MLRGIQDENRKSGEGNCRQRTPGHPGNPTRARERPKKNPKYRLRTFQKASVSTACATNASTTSNEYRNGSQRRNVKNSSV